MEDTFQGTIEQIRVMFEKGIIKNRLSQIKVHSFRKFATDSEINFSFPLTVIVGKNGSGKTTIMKAIKLLSGKEIPQAEFFETVIDDGGLNGANISYTLDGKYFQYKRMRQNEWGKEGTIPDKLNVTYIQTKTMVGAIDKSFLYDNIGKNTSRIQKVEYVIKQSRKIKQNPRSNSERKQRHFISESAVKDINYILQENIKTQMLTFEKVLEIFADYLTADETIEVYISRHGCVRVEFDQDFHYCSGEVCHTPKELFNLLADDYRTYVEIELTKGRRELTEDDEREADALCKRYLERWREELE